MAAEKRSHVAEYFDSDGARRKRPMTRRQAQMFRQCDESVQDYEHNLVDVLPDEVLLLVLSRMASVDLLPLRLVCRRWNELILSPAVWCRRQFRFPRMAFKDTGTTNYLRAAFILYCAPAMDTVDLGYSFPLTHLVRGRCKMRALRCSLFLKEESEDNLYDFFKRVQPSLQSLNVELYSSGFGTNAVLANVLEIMDDAPLTTLALRGSWKAQVPLPAQDFEFRKLQSLQTLLLDDRLLASDLQKGLVRLNQNSLRQVTCLPELLPALAKCPHLKKVTVTACASLRDLYKLTTLDALTVRWTDPGQAVHIRDYFDAADAVEGFKLPSEIHLYVDSWKITTDMLPGTGKGLCKFTTLTFAMGLGWRETNLNFITTMDSLQIFRVPHRVYEDWVDLRSRSLRKIELIGRGTRTEVWLQELRTRWPAIEITVVG